MFDEIDNPVLIVCVSRLCFDNFSKRVFGVTSFSLVTHGIGAQFCFEKNMVRLNKPAFYFSTQNSRKFKLKI